MKVLAIIQARLGSTRFPNKILQKLGNKTIIQILIERLSKTKLIDKIVVATTKSKNDDELVNHIKSLKKEFFRGSENDVLDRYYKTAKNYKPNYVLRITADCPFIDPQIVDKVISSHLKNKNIITSNISIPTFPDGLDVEIFDFEILKKTWSKAKNDFDREHVTPYIKKNYKVNIFKNKRDYSNLRLTLDEPEDLEVLKCIYKYFNNKNNFLFEDIIRLYKKKPKIFKLNSHIKRDEGSYMKKGQKLWKRAKKIIPSGNMFLSKNPETFLPKVWPSYFSRAKGVNVWDLENKKYIDTSLMSVGTNILGYANKRINQKVKKAIEKSVSSTLNCPEEVELCEKLVSMHKWSDMARLARTGGEINAMSIRLSRAFTGKDKVAICGYHGWHDWYLSTNLKNKKNLDQHLFSNLKTEGVPNFLKNSIFQFSYNRIDQLKKIINDNKDIGTIKMEVARNEKPNIKFLKEVREIANRNNIVLIFDECTSGFRETFGGLHLKYKVYPDLATFGKSLGNGYAITALIGKKEIMNKSLDTFISSTFWSERIGPVAALETLKVMEESKSWKTITSLGKRVKNKWRNLARKYDIDASVKGLDAMPIIVFKNHNLIYKTLISQEMLKSNYLASNSFYLSTMHNKDIIDKYFFNLEKVFKKIKISNLEKNPNKFLDTEVCKSNISRMN